MKSEYIAHINEETKEIQTVKEHSESTAALCREFAIPALKDVLYVMGLLHDIGKLQPGFQRRIRGANIKVEHSTCGALAAKKRYPSAVGLMMEYCIAGHHSGLPDSGSFSDTPDMQTLYGRMKREFEDYSAYEQELSITDISEQEFMQYLVRDCGRNISMLVDKFAFLTRYAYSCLVDADWLDTAKFCSNDRPRDLHVDFRACLERVDQRLNSFVCKTDLQKTRSLLQQQVFQKVNRDGEIYLMNMPTGSGKTLASVKWALERAIRGSKKRIIYIIPYNSVIDQTADVFGHLFEGCAEMLRHQSTFSYEDLEDYSEDYREAAKRAAENWSSPFIITTAVQFFESVYSNKRGKLRKLHNMSGSILIFDEAHLMPLDYLQPCLQAVAYITRYLNSEVVFLTATMPDYERLIRQYAIPDCRLVSLVEDRSQFDKFKKCDFEYLGEMESDALLSRAAMYPSSLIIVNRRKSARDLFQSCTGKKYHLSTYMTANDRKRVICAIKEDLKKLEEDYPDGKNVPYDRRITIISTSLIEAGVDLDLHVVFRELAGLDNILQAGGRCNREGRRKEAKTFIFELSEAGNKKTVDEKYNLTRGLLRRYPDVSCMESIEEYYERYFFMKQENIQSHTISGQCQDIRFIPFQEYADHFELIDSRTVAVVVPQDDACQEMLSSLQYAGTGLARKLQKYSCTLQLWELNDLISQNAVKDTGTGVWYLANMDYYDKDTGITFEAKDYLI